MMVVLPEPLYPTIRVRGVLKEMVSWRVGGNERTPKIESFSILDMALMSCCVNWV